MALGLEQGGRPWSILSRFFFLGLVVSLLVAKGVMMAQEHSAEELARMGMEKLGGDLKGSLAVHVARLPRGASRLEDG